MKKTGKYIWLAGWIVIIVLFMVIISSNGNRIILTHPVYRLIDEKEIDASALFYTDIDISLKSERKLNKISYKKQN
jgi:hypothetical protein